MRQYKPLDSNAHIGPKDKRRIRAYRANEFFRTKLYKAMSALGFKCDCGAIKDLHLVHKDGYQAYRAAIKRLGESWIDYLITYPEIRSQYMVKCRACRDL
jgi:hypothetical protein